MEIEGVFVEQSKPRAISESLTVESIISMQRSLLRTAGEDTSTGLPKGVAVQYYRSVLSRRGSGAQARELLNLCSAIDALLRGRPCAALDILTQRVKAQEACLHGTPWAVALQLEIPESEQQTIAARGEMQMAFKENYAESKNRWANQSQGSGRKGDGKTKQGKNNKGDRDGQDHKDKKDEKKNQTEDESSPGEAGAGCWPLRAGTGGCNS